MWLKQPRFCLSNLAMAAVMFEALSVTTALICVTGRFQRSRTSSK